MELEKQILKCKLIVYIKIKEPFSQDATCHFDYIMELSE